MLIGMGHALAAGDFPQIGWKNSIDTARVAPGYRRIRPARFEVVGAHRWAFDPRSGIYCMAYAVDDKPPQLWVPPDPAPPEFFEAQTNTDWRVAAHNDPYEFVVRAAHSASSIWFSADPARAPYLHASGCPGTWLAGKA